MTIAAFAAIFRLASPRTLHAWGLTSALIFVCLSTLHAHPTTAQVPNGNNGGNGGQQKPAVDEEIAKLEQAIADVDANTELSDEEKTRLKQVYQDTIQAIQNRQQFSDALAADEQAIASAEQTLKDTRTEYEDTATEPDPTYGQDKGDLSQVESELNELRPKLESEQKRVTELEQERTRRTTRRKEIPPRLDEITKEITTVNEELAKAPPENESAAVTAARKALLTARLASLQAEQNALQTELRRYDAENELLPAQTDLARRKSLLFGEQVQILSELLVELRQTEAESQVSDAKRAEEQFAASPSLTKIAQDVQAMAEQRIELTEKLKGTAAELTKNQDRLKRLQEEFKRTKNRVENIGTVSAIGSLLRKQRAALPDSTVIRQKIIARQNEIRETELSLYDAADARNRFSDPDKRAKTLADETGIASERILPLLTSQRTVAGDLERELDEYFNRLVDLNTTSQRTLQEIEAFTAYIDENILWIRSNSPVWEMSLSEFVDSSQEVLGAANWQSIGQDLWQAFKENLPLAIAVGAFLLLLYWERRRMRRLIEKQGALVQPVTSTKFKPTMATVGLTIGISLVWPLIFFFVGWLATRSNTSHTIAMGRALTSTGFSVFALEFIRQTCRRDGLALTHFRWPERVVTLVRRTVRWGMLVIVPFSFLLYYTRELDNEVVREGLERVVFMLLQVVGGYIAFTLFRPRLGVFQEHLQNYPDGWINRMRYVWFAVVLVVPLALFILAFVGYLYTAEQLYDRFRASFLILLILLVISGLLTRWVLISRRRLRLQQLRNRLSQSGIDLSGLPIESSTDVDLRTINFQSKRLILSLLVIVGLVGLYLVWASVLPALQVLDEAVLWEVDQGEGKDPMEITLKHLLFLIPILCGTWIAARNAPGLLEIAVLQRLPLESSVRYAITTLASYIIVIIGVVLSCSMIGINWSSVQFIVAALGVGLGFGLQEIFANFVSGIILLFERPIRVGDIVTIGDVTGVVTRIHIRATTITNWDLKEYVVPNKDLVTGRLLNWTLSDTTNRVTINVGVSYSSNPEHVTRLLTEILEQHPAVLDDPQSLVTFESFGDNSLLFVIRTYIASLSNRLQTIHELHTQIFNRFVDEGVEISFPQLDLHVKTVSSMAVDAMRSARDNRSAQPSQLSDPSQSQS